MSQKRREFLAAAGSTMVGISFAQLSGIRACASTISPGKKPLFKISLTEYSFHRMIAAKKLDNLDFTQFTKKTFGIDAVEYWNRPFFQKANDANYLREMKKRADNAGVKGLVILIDGEGNLGDPDEKKRHNSVERHKKWVDAAKTLGCHSIRVNARSKGSYQEQLKLSADGLANLCEYGKTKNCNVIVENHGGLSSNGKWLTAVMKKVGMKNCGTLPDFGNFQKYDRYQGVKDLMPFAKSVSAKSHTFDKHGNETQTDFRKMLKIVVDAGYDGYVGIEFEGGKISEVEGVKKTKKLLERVRAELSST